MFSSRRGTEVGRDDSRTRVREKPLNAFSDFSPGRLAVCGRCSEVQCRQALRNIASCFALASVGGSGSEAGAEAALAGRAGARSGKPYGRSEVLVDQNFA